MSVQDIENMTLMQKQSIADVMESTVEDVEAHRAKLAAAEAQAAAAASSVTPEPGLDAPKASSDVAMSPVDEDEEEQKRKEELERVKEMQRAQALQSSSINVAGPMKIRTDYVPKCMYPMIPPFPFPDMHSFLIMNLI
jgi:splicing factor 3A subunit 1